MKKLFKNKNFFLLFQGSLVSAIGTTLYSFAAVLYINALFGRDNGAIYLALFYATGITIQVLLSPITGVIVDKVNKIKVLYITDIIRGLLFFATLYILNLGLPKETLIWILLGVTCIASINQAFFGPASMSTIPEIVGEDQIQEANGAITVINSVQGILGVFVGIFLYAFFGFKIAVLINAISFIFSAITEMFIKTNPELVSKQQDEHENKPTFFQDIKFGFKYLKDTTGLLTMMIFSALLNFCFSPIFSVGIPYLFMTELGRTEYELGATEVVFSVTMLIASFIIGGLKLKSLKKSVFKGLLTMTVSFLLLSGSIVLVSLGVISYWYFFGLFILVNIFLAFSMVYTNVPLNTGMMKAIDAKVRGRVFAVVSALSMIAIPISTMIAGVITDYYNTAYLSVVFTIIVMFVAFGFTSNKKISFLLDNIDKKSKEEVIEEEQVPDVNLQEQLETV